VQTVSKAYNPNAKEEPQSTNSVTDTLPRFEQEPLNDVETDSSSVYTVGEGDTLYSISKKYNLTVKDLQDMNGLMDTAISLGQELKVKPEAKKIIYIVEKGDTLYSVSKKYNTTIQTLQILNGLNDTAISIGQELLVKQ
jgi:LysM repeat protein